MKYIEQKRQMLLNSIIDHVLIIPIFLQASAETCICAFTKQALKRLIIHIYIYKIWSQCFVFNQGRDLCNVNKNIS